MIPYERSQLFLKTDAIFIPAAGSLTIVAYLVAKGAYTGAAQLVSCRDGASTQIRRPNGRDSRRRSEAYG